LANIAFFGEVLLYPISKVEEKSFKTKKKKRSLIILFWILS